MSAVRITIPKFKEYNPRSDVKHNSWIRLNCKTWIDRKLFGASVLTRYVWVCCLCVVGEEGKGTDSLEFQLEWFAANVGAENQDVQESLKDLGRRGLIVFEDLGALRARDEHVTCTIRDVPHTVLTRRDERDETNETNKRDETDVSSPLAAKAREVFDLWNQFCDPLPKVRKLTVSMAEKIRQRLSEEPDLAYWQTAITNLATSPFCRESSWADFHWLIKNDTNHAKAHANKYGNKARAKAGFQRDTNADDEIAAMEARVRAQMEASL